MPGLGFGGMGGATGAGDAIAQIFDQRLKAAQLSQQDALTRLKIQELADAHEETLRQRQQADADRAQANAEKEHARTLTEATNNYKLLGPTTPISAGTHDQMVSAGLPPEAFAPQGVTPPEPPPSIAAPGMSGPEPGTVANSPAPAQRVFTRLPTPQETQQQKEEAAYQQLSDLFPVGSRERTVLDYEHATGKNAPTSLVGNPNEPLEQVDTPQGPKYLPRSQSVGLKPYHPPVPPAITASDLGPLLVNRNRGTASAITGPNGQPVGPQTPQALKVEASHKADAIASLDQLDQAIEAAKEFIGPGEGRVSNLEQMAGFADPKVQALGTKMLLAKMKVDAGIGGARAAASPQLLARWDNLLANKVTPEGLHAAVQAMREILGINQKTGTKKTAEELIRQYGGGNGR